MIVFANILRSAIACTALNKLNRNNMLNVRLISALLTKLIKHAA